MRTFVTYVRMAWKDEMRLKNRICWLKVVTDDCFTDEGTPPPPCASSVWPNNEINVVGGWWCCCTHLYGVDDFLHLHYLILLVDILNIYIVTHTPLRTHLLPTVIQGFCANAHGLPTK